MCLVTINFLNGSGKKPWKHARRPAGPLMLGEGRSCPSKKTNLGEKM